MIGLIDYGMGNRRSAEKALQHVGADTRLTSDPHVLRRADGLVLPGVGAFPEAMRRIDASGLSDLIRERVAEGVPLLGICLGMQLLFDHSEEHEGADGLKLIPGSVRWLRPGPGQKLPHIGWNLVTFQRPSPMTTHLKAEAAFYHVHSLVPRPENDQHIVGTSEYGERFASVVQNGHVMGTQFHPEKSSLAGMALLRGFVESATRPRTAQRPGPARVAI